MPASHNRITVRFGDAVLEDGFTTVPNLVLKHFAGLGITHSEMLFTVCVWQYWWSDKDPYPGLQTIADRLGISWRQAHRYAKSLETKGFLTITHRLNDNGGQTTSEYDFSQLLEAVVKATYPPDGSVRAPAVRFDRPPSDTDDRAPLSRMTDEEDSDKEDSDKEDLSREAREFFDGYIRDFSREFRDQAPKSSLTRVVNLWRTSELDLYTFRDRMMEARDTTKRYTGTVKKGDGGHKQLMPYWFSILADLVNSRG